MTNDGIISTGADDAQAVFAQSVGGGGGRAGSSTAKAWTIAFPKFPAFAMSVGVALGGSGGDGISAKSHRRFLRAYRDTYSPWKDFGKNVGKDVLMQFLTFSANFNFGGQGGSGNVSGRVDVVNDGAINTLGDRAYGIFAQSIGGGGVAGTASRNANAWFELGGGFSFDKPIGLGFQLSKSPGSAGDGGGRITDMGVRLGIAGAGNGGYGGQVSVSGGDIQTTGAGAPGLVAQSIAGGGGLVALEQIGTTTRVDLGAASAIGTASDVRVTANGELNTSGDGSLGIVAQSIGRGGGLVLGVTGQGRADAVALGAANATNGARSGAVVVRHHGEIVTEGAAAHGIVAQTIGGGGGLVGPPADTVSIPGAASGSRAGNLYVDVHENARVETRGLDAAGVVAQVLGGNGGLVGAGWGRPLTMLDRVVKTDASSSSGIGTGRLDIDVAGSVLASGEHGVGVLAMNLSGGGLREGVIEMRDSGRPGLGNVTVSVKQTGEVEASGSGGIGVMSVATPTGNGGGSNASRVLIDGSVRGGTGPDAAGVFLVGGQGNLVEIDRRGRLEAGEGVDGNAIVGRDLAATTVNVIGTLVGSVDLGDGPDNHLLVTPQGRFDAGALVRLSTRNIRSRDVGLQVDGTLEPGGPNRALTTRVIGPYAQSGTLVVDLDMQNDYGDRVEVTGPATVGGEIVPRFSALLPGKVATVLTATQDLDWSGRARDSVFFDYAADRRSGNRELALRVDRARFTSAVPLLLASDAGLAIAEHLQLVWDHGADGFSADGAEGYGMLFAGLAQYQTKAEAASIAQDLANMYASDKGLVGADNALGSASANLNRSLSCPVFTGEATELRQAECAWARMTRGNEVKSGADSGARTTSDTWALQIGAQKQIGEGWFLGGSATYGEQDVRQRFSKGEGRSYDLGIALKREIGAWLLAAAANVGHTDYDYRRWFSLPFYSAELAGSGSVVCRYRRVLVAEQTCT